jgi:arsenite methyltransferase
MTGSPLPFEALLAEGDQKACCASVYEAEPVRWLLGESFHPGGSELTLRTAELAAVGRGQRVLDVASGPGTSTLLLAAELGAEVVGVELGEAAVAAARAEAERAGLRERVSFVGGDAEALPFESSSFDAVICECSLCTFPDKRSACHEMVRVLVPGGRVAVADVTTDHDQLPAPLRTAAARIACVADALPVAGYTELLKQAGLKLVAIEAHDAALAAMVDRVEARLRLARMLRVPALSPYQGQLAEAVELARLAACAIRDGALGYSVMVGESTS